MNIAPRRVLVLGCLVLVASAPPASGQPRPVGGVFLTFDDADHVPKAANRYRVYETPSRLCLSFSLTNDSKDAYTIRNDALLEHVQIEVSLAGHDVPVTVSWTRLEPGADSAPSETRIVTGRAGHWRVSLARADGRPFEGEYAVRFSLAGALKTVRDDNGEPWGGRSLNRTISGRSQKRAARASG